MTKQFSSIEFDTLKELLDTLSELNEVENIEQAIVHPTPNGWAADITSRPFDGTEGQDRDNYTDNQSDSDPEITVIFWEDIRADAIQEEDAEEVES